MSKEQRTVRPFVGLEPFASALDLMRLHVGEDSIEPGDRVLLGPESYSLRRIVLEVAPDDDSLQALRSSLQDAAEAIGLGPSQIDLLVIASSTFLKLSDILLRVPLTDLDSIERLSELAGASKPSALSTPFSGSRIDIYVCLNEDVEKQPLRPWRRGTWLAHVDFRIETELSSSGFTPRPLTAEIAEHELGVPRATTRVIRIADQASPLDEDSSEDMVEMWVNAELLAQLSVNSGTKTATLFQAQLVLDAIAAIIDAARRDERFSSSTFDEIEKTLLGRTIEAVAGRKGTRPERLERCRALHHRARADAGTAEFLAFAEEAIGLTKAAISAVEE